MTDEEAEAARRGKDFPRACSKLALNAAFLPRGMLPTKIYLGMDWLGFVKIKSAGPTSGELRNSICLGFCSFPPWTSKAGVENWAEVTWGQMAGTEIAKEEIAFGNSVKTFGTCVLYLTPALGERAGGLTEKESMFEDSSSSSSGGRG